MCRKPTACPVETCGVSFLLSVEGKTERNSRLSRAGRRGSRQPTHLLHQEVLLYVVGHRIPDGNSLWRAKKSRSHSASAASRHRYRCQAGVRWQMGSVVSILSLAAAPLLWWLWTHVPWVSVHVCLEAHRAAGPSLQKLILFRLVPAGCSLLAPAMPELIPSDASALCQMLLQDAGPTSVHRLRTPPGWPCHKRRRGDSVGSAGRSP